MKKAHELLRAESQADKRELRMMRISQGLLESTTGSRKRVRYPKGQFFDPDHFKDHRGQLAERGAREAQR